MKYFLIFALFALGAHLLDAVRHYVKEDEPFSAVWNLMWGLIAVLIGFALCLK